MANELLLRGIEEMPKVEEELEMTDGRLTSENVPEFAKMTLQFRSGERVEYPKILTKLTFPTAGLMMIVKHDTDKPELVIINMNMVGDKDDIISVHMVDLSPEEEPNEV